MDKLDLDKLGEVEDYIYSTWTVTNVTSNRLYFKYKDLRGMPKYYLNRKTGKVVRLDKSKESSKDAITVEVKTRVYSILDPSVEPVDAQDVFNLRNEDFMKELVEKYNGRDDQQGGE